MAIKALKSISRFVTVLILLSISTSGAFASENANLANSTNPGYDPGSYPAKDITEENFTEVQADILDSISKRITELQSLYNEISKVSNASDLQKILSSHRQVNEDIRPVERHMEPDGIKQEPRKMSELLGLGYVENVTDTNYTDVKIEITNLLGNMTEMLEAEQTRLTEAGEDDRAEELGGKINELQNLSTDVSEASTAAELKKVVFTYMKTQSVDSLENEIELLQVKVNDSENMSNGSKSEEVSSRIMELTSLIEDINGAKSIGDLKEIMSSRERSEAGVDNTMLYEDQGRSMGPRSLENNKYTW